MRFLIFFLGVWCSAAFSPQKHCRLTGSNNFKQYKVVLNAKSIVVNADELQQVPISSRKESLSVAELCFAGGLATSLGAFIMYPLDTVKVAQQASG
jgi:hypothetical protein